jgi:hypothetical protein
MCILLSLTIAVGGETGDYMMPFLKDREPTESTWVLHVMSFAVLLAWTELMLLIGRFPTCGYYALMFYQVLQNVVKVQYFYLSQILSSFLTLIYICDDNILRQIIYEFALNSYQELKSYFLCKIPVMVTVKLIRDTKTEIWKVFIAFLCLNSSYITFQSTPLNYAILTIFSDLYKS